MDHFPTAMLNVRLDSHVSEAKPQAPGRSQVAVVVPPPTAGPCPGVLLLPPAAMRSDLVGESNGIYHGVYHDIVVDCLSMFLPFKPPLFTVFRSYQ